MFYTFVKTIIKVHVMCMKAVPSNFLPIKKINMKLKLLFLLWCVFKAGNTLEAEASRDTVWHPRRISPRTKECFSVSARRGMFCPYCAWGGEFLGLVSLWSTDNRWLGSHQPLRHVAWIVMPPTLAKERVPRHASASCLSSTFDFSSIKKNICGYESIINI